MNKRHFEQLKHANKAIKIILNGAHGKMGRVTVDAIAHEKDLQLVATASRQDDLFTVIQAEKVDVAIDFTRADCVFDNAQKIIAAGARPVIGTSGLTEEQIEILSKQCREKKIGGIIAPNFSMGAVLMMKYAKDAAQHFSDVEIVEFHHPQKSDAPSSTARKTAEYIEKAQKNRSHEWDANSNDHDSRGLHHHNIPIHAVRLSGVFANQEVYFGNASETLMIAHRTLDRHAMMPGLFLCCRKVMALDHLVYGMENLIQ